MRQAANASGISISAVEATGRAYSPTSDPDVNLRLRLDVTDAALIAPGQYRKSLVDEAIASFNAALAAAGAEESEYSVCGIRQPDGKATVTITAFIAHDGTTTDVSSSYQTRCFNP